MKIIQFMSLSCEVTGVLQNTLVLPIKYFPPLLRFYESSFTLIECYLLPVVLNLGGYKKSSQLRLGK
jgi:hypothetical protein